MTEIVLSAKAGKKEYAKLNKAIHDCDKTIDKVWYAKGMMMLKMRASGLYKFGQGKPTFDENGKEVFWTFEDWLESEFQLNRSRGYQLLDSVSFVRKLEHANVHQNAILVDKKMPVLPSNERQIRPLLTSLKHDGERIHVWQQVVQSGEKKITADMVQRHVDEFKASGQVVEDVEIKLPDVDVSLNNYRSIGSGENEWYTPQEYADMAREVMGSIDLDPASNAEANQTIKATTFYTKDDDGLKKQWAGNVWLNPPYSRDLMPAFVDKLKQSYMDGDVGSAILVSHNNTDTAWFHSLAEAASAICFPKNRIRFYRGEEVAAPTNGQAFFYLGNDTKKFASVFAETGFVVTPYGDVA